MNNKRPTNVLAGFHQTVESVLSTSWTLDNICGLSNCFKNYFSFEFIKFIIYTQKILCLK